MKKEFARGDVRVTAFATAGGDSAQRDPNVFVDFGENGDAAQVVGFCEIGYETISAFELRWGVGARADAEALAKCESYSELEPEFPELAALMKEVEAWYHERIRKDLW